MTEYGLPPAVTGEEMRLDVLIALQQETLAALRDLSPAAPDPEPQDGETIELREPETPPEKPRRRR